MVRLVAVAILLAGCSGAPTVNWGQAAPAKAPALLPLDGLLSSPPMTAKARGDALAAKAAALRARTSP